MPALLHCLQQGGVLHGGESVESIVATALRQLLVAAVPRQNLSAAAPSLARMLRSPDAATQEQAVAALLTVAQQGDEARGLLAAAGAIPPCCTSRGMLCVPLGRRQARSLLPRGHRWHWAAWQRASSSGLWSWQLPAAQHSLATSSTTPPIST